MADDPGPPSDASFSALGPPTAQSPLSRRSACLWRPARRDDPPDLLLEGLDVFVRAVRASVVIAGADPNDRRIQLAMALLREYSEPLNRPDWIAFNTALSRQLDTTLKTWRSLATLYERHALPLQQAACRRTRRLQVCVVRYCGGPGSATVYQLWVRAGRREAGQTLPGLLLPLPVRHRVPPGAAAPAALPPVPSPSSSRADPLEIADVVVPADLCASQPSPASIAAPAVPAVQRPPVSPSQPSPASTAPLRPPASAGWALALLKLASRARAAGGAFLDRVRARLNRPPSPPRPPATNAYPYSHISVADRQLTILLMIDRATSSDDHMWECIAAVLGLAALLLFFTGLLSVR